MFDTNNRSISITDIENLLAIKASESINLAFKSGNELSVKDDRSLFKFLKVISSFANTSGGFVVYGIKPMRRKATEYSFVNGHEVSSVLLNNILNTSIFRHIEDLKIHEIQVDNDPLKSIFVFEIPESKYAPHMISDKRFYRRFNFREVPMEENEIRASYSKTKVTDLEFFGVLNTNGVPNLRAGKFENVNFYPKFLIRNAGNIIEKTYKVELFVPSEIVDSNFKPLHQHFARYEGKHNVYSISNSSPIFQEELATVIEANLVINKDNYFAFEDSEIIVKIFFSNGIKTHKVILKDAFRYKGNMIEQTDFSYLQEIKEAEE